MNPQPPTNPVSDTLGAIDTAISMPDIPSYATSVLCTAERSILAAKWAIDRDRAEYIEALRTRDRIAARQREIAQSPQVFASEEEALTAGLYHAAHNVFVAKLKMTTCHTESPIVWRDGEWHYTYRLYAWSPDFRPFVLCYDGKWR